MLEALLPALSKKIVVPTFPTNLGPGPQTLIGGDVNAGFFGELPASQLINGTNLAAAVGLTAGSVIGSLYTDANWLKFIIDGKIVYCPKKPYRYGVSWDNLQATNIVDGSRAVSIGEDDFKVRLFKGYSPDNSVIYSDGYDPACTHGSEWNRLLYPITAVAAHLKPSQVDPNWVNYTEDELSLGFGTASYVWCQETPYNRPEERMMRGGSGVSYTLGVARNYSDTYRGWRPVLELVS